MIDSAKRNSGPDKQLLAIGAEFTSLDQRLVEMDTSTQSSADDQRQDLLDRWQAVIGAATAYKARTAAGRAVKAQMVLAVVRVTDPQVEPLRDLAVSLALDLVKGGRS